MKKTLAKIAVLFLLGIIGLCTQAATPTSFNIMYIHRGDGVSERLLIDEKLEFQLSDEGTLRLVHPQITLEFEIDELSHFSFDYDKTMTDVYDGDHQASISSPNMAENDITISITSELIQVNGAKEIAIYDIKGIKVASCAANNGIASIPTSTLPKGVHIIKAGNSTIKVKL
jgi:hypothetical protein